MTVRKPILNAATEAAVNSLLRRAQITSAPVDLMSLARQCHVSDVQLRAMIPKGGLSLSAEGFQIFIRADESRSLRIGDAESTKALSAQQRFTFAHEIAHTLYFDRTQDPPVNKGKSLRYGDLEAACDAIAARLLVPSQLLQKHLGDDRDLSIELVFRAADAFRASIEVIVRRLNDLTAALPQTKGLFLLQADAPQELRLRAACFRAGLRTFVPVDDEDDFVNWCHSLPNAVLGSSGPTQWQTANRAGDVLVRKSAALGRRSQFLLECEGVHR